MSEKHPLTNPEDLLLPFKLADWLLRRLIGKD